MRRLKETLQAHHAAHVDQHERGGERRVDQRAVDDHVYVVEAVAQDGDARRDGQPGQRQQPHEESQIGGQPLRQENRRAQTCAHESRGIGEPLELLAFDAAGPAKADDQRGRRSP